MLAAGLVGGEVDIRDPLVRAYLLTFEAHLPPSLADDQPGLLLDDLLVLHARVRKLTADKHPAQP